MSRSARWLAIGSTVVAALAPSLATAEKDPPAAKRGPSAVYHAIADRHAKARVDHRHREVLIAALRKAREAIAKQLAEAQARVDARKAEVATTGAEFKNAGKTKDSIKEGASLVALEYLKRRLDRRTTQVDALRKRLAEIDAQLAAAAREQAQLLQHAAAAEAELRREAERIKSTKK
jgi:hypothetical protein